MSAIHNRYEFVFFFDVINGNPNGDPDAGNMPRLDPETNQGLVTDVCLKRKIRNFVSLAKEKEAGYDIYMQEKSVLNNQHKKAYEAIGIEPVAKKLPKDHQQALDLTQWMCNNYYDVRAFGAVMTTEVNAGQVRGPIQIAFAKSEDPIVPLEISITRMAVTNEKDLEKERTMGRKHIVPYGLYRVHGYVSAKLAEKTNFSEGDLQLLWQSMVNMFEHDHSAARGEMSARKLYVFKHDNALGNAPAHKLFELVSAKRIKGEPGSPAQAFSDYDISLNAEALPEGVSVEEVL
ncbi:MAG: type I-C CRISPR-associated protein Cas7/Csd2 [Oceanospirillaceae bacterium]|nr:type I-C CRISPR-associated protein Cas7/Csd2 [Oceanospirillaceae bacterium]MBT10825.1 type I-C CRISPR-associated protein Cas7/Csd2 [Oceanospirillaceae bacterium]